MNLEHDVTLLRPYESAEFAVSTDLDGFPVTECPAYMKDAVGAVCLSGSAVIRVFGHECRVEPDRVITIIPWQFASISEMSDDFSLLYYRASQTMFTDSLSSLWRLTPEFFSYMHRHILSQREGAVNRRFTTFCNLLVGRAVHAPEVCRRESVMQLLRLHYWDVYTVYIADPEARKANYSRKEELAFRFMRLIIEQHSPDKDVAFYADKLQISPKSLTNLIHSVSGRSARDWIVYFTILEIKALLRQSSMDLKSIVARVRFPDQSTLSRFFHRYTGMTPTKYRQQIHF